MKTTIKIFLISFILFFLGYSIYWTQVQMDQERKIQFVDRSPVFLPKGNVLKALSMGYRGLMADWLWIKAVVYTGRRLMDEGNVYYLYEMYGGDKEKIADAKAHHDQFHQHGEAYQGDHKHHAHAAIDSAHLFKRREMLNRVREELNGYIPPKDSVFMVSEKLKKNLYRFESRGLFTSVYPLLDRVTILDPYFEHAYIWGGVYLLHETGEIEAARKLLERGRKYNPNDWQYPFYLGWLHWMYKGEMEKTYHYLLEAVKLKECPKFVGSLLQAVTQNVGRIDFTIIYLHGIYDSTEDPEIRENIQEILNSLDEESASEHTKKDSDSAGNRVHDQQHEHQDHAR